MEMVRNLLLVFLLSVGFSLLSAQEINTLKVVSNNDTKGVLVCTVKNGKAPYNAALVSPSSGKSIELKKVTQVVFEQVKKGAYALYIQDAEGSSYVGNVDVK